MAVSFVGAWNSGGAASPNGTDAVTWTLPSSCQVNDVAICIVYSRAYTKRVTNPDATQITGQYVYAGADNQGGMLWVGWAKLDATMISDGHVGHADLNSVTNGTTGWITAVFREIDYTAPIRNYATPANSGTAGNPDPPSCSSTSGECMVAIFGSMDQNDGVTAPTNFTIPTNGGWSTTAGTDGSSAIAYDLDGGTGSAVDPAVFTTTTDSYWYATTLNLKTGVPSYTATGNVNVGTVSLSASGTVKTTATAALTTGTVSMSASGEVPKTPVGSGLVHEYIGKLADGGTSQGHNDGTPTGTWDDLVGGADGTLSGVAYTSSSGWSGAGTAADPYAFTGAGDNDLVLADTATVNTTWVFSVEAWVKSSNASDGFVDYCDKTTSANCEALLCTNATPIIRFVCYDDAGAFAAAGSASINDGNWHHLVGTSDGTDIRMYKDGVIDGSAVARPAGTATRNRVAIGAEAPGTYRDFWLGPSGSVATVRIYDKCLSSTEVLNNYQAGILKTAQRGSASLSVGTVSLSASGTVGAGAVTGTGNVNVGATLSASGTEKTTATGALTTGTVSLSATGVVRTTATAGLTVGDVALAATGVVRTTATGNITVADATLSGSGAYIDKVTTRGLVYEYLARLADGGTSQGHNDGTPTGTWDELIAAKDGTLNSFAYDATSGWIGTGTAADPYRLIFDGSSDYVDVGDTGLCEDDTYSYEAWVFLPTGATLTKYLVTEGTTADSTNYSGIYLSYSPTVFTARMNRRGTGDGSGQITTGGTAFAADNAMHHVVGTCDGDNITAYLDGVQFGSSAAISANSVSVDKTYFGAAPRGTVSYGTGNIATIRMYSVALTADEILANYLAGPLASSFVGSGGLTVGTVALAATGEESAPSFEGTGNLNVGTVELGVSFTETIPATASITVGEVALSASGTTTVPASSGSGGLTTGTVALAASGAVRTTATGSITSSASLAASGTHSIPNSSGTGNVNVGTVALSSSGTLTERFTIAMEVAPVALAASASVGGGVTGTGAMTLTPVSLSAAGTVRTTATGSITAPTTTLDADGSTRTTATGSLTTGTVSMSASGANRTTATGGVAVPTATLDADGTHTIPNVSGSGGVEVGTVALSGSAMVASSMVEATGNVTVAPVSISASGGLPQEGSGGVVAASVSLAAQGVIRTKITGGVTVGASISASGTHTAEPMTAHLMVGSVSLHAHGWCQVDYESVGSYKVVHKRPPVATQIGDIIVRRHDDIGRASQG